MFAQQKRNRLWSLLSLWALLALAMPQLLWACPMSGKVGSTPAQACPCAAQNEKAQDAAAPIHDCCKRVPLPSSDTTGSGESGVLSQSRAVSFLLQPFTPGALLAVAAFELSAPATQPAAFSPTTSPPLISQQSSSLHSGRAPPF